MEKVSRVVDSISTIFGYIAGSFLVLSVLLVVMEVVLRTFFNSTLAITQEYMAYFMVAITFIGLAYTLKEKEHIRMVFLHKLIKQGKPRFFLDLYSYLIGLAAFIIITITTFNFFWNSVVTGSQAMQLSRTYLAIPQFSLVLGSALISLQFVSEILKSITKYRKSDVYVEESESDILGR